MDEKHENAMAVVGPSKSRIVARSYNLLDSSNEDNINLIDKNSTGGVSRENRHTPVENHGSQRMKVLCNLSNFTRYLFSTAAFSSASASTSA